jgi:hypothetical protein
MPSIRYHVCIPPALLMHGKVGRRGFFCVSVFYPFCPFPVSCYWIGIGTSGGGKMICHFLFLEAPMCEM